MFATVFVVFAGWRGRGNNHQALIALELVATLPDQVSVDDPACHSLTH